MKSAGAVLLLLWSGVVVAAAERGGLHHQATGVAAASTQQSDLTEVRAMQRQMIAQMAEQREELRLAKAQLEKQVEELKNGALKPLPYPANVAFSTSFSVKTDKHIGPFQKDTTLLFDCVFTNIGDSYDKTKGLFTAPRDGVYQFNYHIFAGGDNGAGAKLIKNQDQIVAAYNHKAPHDINTSQSVILKLQSGDTVCLRLEAGWWVAAYTGHLTTFSGHMLFPTSER
ncbi:complement C1q-like protein 4 [Sardina pilchardus]|uniref:complement C1q-like protein 4 n=1 Tax=Sardina pilchardus TaxID=27697 RepID=UPI002E0E2848